jgi:hypothetical protein
MPPGAALQRYVLASLHLVVLLLPTAHGRPIHPGMGAHARNCQLDSWSYTPSKLEKLWTENVDAWSGDDFCDYQAKFQDNITYWLETNAKLMLTERQHAHTAADDVFSAYSKTYICAGNKSHTRTSWIEPLAFALRHPNGICGNSLLGRDYLLLDSVTDVQLDNAGACPPRCFLFDMGASLYTKGGGGPSQSFLIDAYKLRGITFDRMLLWEATPHEPSAVFASVPRSLHASYQYINIPVSAERGDPGNPLEIIKAITSPFDFVAVKLDIDTPLIENQLVQQILEDSDIYDRIDEFFFEHHVNFKPMARWWGSALDTNHTLASSYHDIFLALRKRGVRAHGWP